MVRINLVDPRRLADQHLIAEYVEILMLVATAKRYPLPRSMPAHYMLGKGHVTFFKDKLGYLVKRHGRIKREMRRRGFRPTKSVDLRGTLPTHRKSWRPRPTDFLVIRKRLLWKIRQKPGYYRYCGKVQSYAFFRNLFR